MKYRIAAALLLALFATSCTSQTPPPVASSTDQWAALRRPLQLPHLTTGQSCPRSEWKPLTALNAPPELGTTGYTVLGGGPAYPILYDFDVTTGVLSFKSFVLGSAARQNQDGFGKLFWDKTRWIIDGNYLGSVLIRTARLDGPGDPVFNDADHPMELLIAGVSPPAWRDHPGATGVTGPGCYGFQIDGPDFTKTLVFQVVP